MYQIDDSTVAATLPTPAAAGTAGYFTDGNPSLQVPPTVVPADFFNSVMLELLNVLTAASITPSKTQYNQVLLSIEELIEARTGNYLVDTGVANAYIVTMSPPVTAYPNGLTGKFRATHANTGACTLNAGAGAEPLTRDDGTPLQSGDISVNGIVSWTYDLPTTSFLVNSVVPSQFGAVAKENFGLGVKDDGSGNLTLKLADGSMRLTSSGLQGNEPITTLSGTVNIVAANHFANFVGTGTLDLPLSSTLWNGFCFSVNAQGGSPLLTPNSADKINGQTAGQSYTLLQGVNALFVTDGNGNWWPFYQTVPPDYAPAPAYINSSQTIGVGQYLVDTSAGPVTLTLTASPGTGGAIVLEDACGTWTTNPVILAPNTNTIRGSASNFIFNISGEAQVLLFKSGNWSIV